MIRSLPFAAGVLALALSFPAVAAPPAGTTPAQPKPKPAAGQPKPAGTTRGGRTRAALAKLSLSEDQKAAIKKAQAAGRAEIKRIQASNAPPDEKKTQLRAARKKVREDVAKILTPEQKKQFQAEMKKSAPAKTGSKPPAPKPTAAKK